MGNVNMEASQINYRGGEKKMSVEEALKNTSGEAAAIAQLQTDVLNLNSNKANQITIAPFFSAEASYDPGDLVYYNGLSYRCVNAHEGEWDADDFAATTVANELDSLKSGLTNLIVSDIKSSVGQTVAAGDDAMFTIDVTKQGYTPIFYTAINTSNSRLVPYYYALSGNTLSVAVHNYATGSLDGAVSALVLYRHS